MIKVIFFGTPDYVIPVVEALNKYYKVVAVVTQEPKLVGRKQLKSYSAVDDWAHKRKILVIRDWQTDLPEANLGVVASFGKIIPDKVIHHFPSGILNIHPSLLPKYRGTSPLQYQIMDGVKQTGISVIKMDSKMDHGPIVSVQKEEIKEDDTNESLRIRLFEKSAKFLIELLPNYLGNRINVKEQDHDEATITQKIDKDTGFVDLQKDDPVQIDRKFRALSPWPGIWTYVDIEGKKMRLKINNMHSEEGKVVLDRVQLEGKKAVDFKQFKEAYPNSI